MKVNRIYEKAQSCVYAVNELEGNIIESAELESAVVDTWKKGRAYAKYNARLSGHDFEPIEPNLQNCDFKAKSGN
jgi:hypothetical protein